MSALPFGPGVACVEAVKTNKKNDSQAKSWYTFNTIILILSTKLLNGKVKHFF